MIANPKNLTEQLLNLSERVATEMRVLNRTKVSTINGQVPDANGNIEIAAGGGGSGDSVPKTGDRGLLAGYNTCHKITVIDDPVSVTVDANSPDDMLIETVGSGTLTLTFANSNGEAYVKNILLMGDPSNIDVEFGDSVVTDTFFNGGYVNDLGLSAINQIVVTSYALMEDMFNVFVSNKKII